MERSSVGCVVVANGKGRVADDRARSKSDTGRSALALESVLSVAKAWVRLRDRARILACLWVKSCCERLFMAAKDGAAPLAASARICKVSWPVPCW